MYTPIIMPRSSHYGNNYWNSDGPKVGMREVILYSDLEFDHWVLVETDPTVETYCEQPLEITYVIDGLLHSSIFDIWIKYRDGQLLFREVKYESELNPNDPRNQRTMRQIEAQKLWCDQNGYRYEVITEKTIRSSHFSLENRLKILSYIKNNPEPELASEILRYISSKPIRLEKLTIESTQPIGAVLEACMWLLYKGDLTGDLDSQILSKNTEVRLNEP